MPELGDVVVEVEGFEIRSWTSYSIDSDLLQPSDAFEMTMAVPGDFSDRRGFLEAVKDGKEIKVYVEHEGDRSLQMTGPIDERFAGGDRNGGLRVTLQGRDRAAHLIDSSADLTVFDEDEVLFIDVVRRQVEPWGIEVVSEAETARSILTGAVNREAAARLQERKARALGVPASDLSRSVEAQAARERRPVDEVAGASSPDPRAGEIVANGYAPGDIERLRLKDARPRPGETVWELLERHAKRLGILMWMSPDGKLILSSPTYEDEPLYRLVRRFQDDPADRNNILSGGHTRRMGDRLKSVTVYGKAWGGDVTRSPFSNTELDDDVPFYRPLVIHDSSIRDAAEASRRAVRELNLRRMNAELLEYGVVGHGQGHIFSVDTIATVIDEYSDVDGDYYVVRRGFSRDRQSGTHTQVQLMPKHAIVL